MAALKRINKEKGDLEKTPSDHYSAGPAGTDMFLWQGRYSISAMDCTSNSATVSARQPDICRRKMKFAYFNASLLNFFSFFRFYVFEKLLLT